MNIIRAIFRQETPQGWAWYAGMAMGAALSMLPGGPRFILMFVSFLVSFKVLAGLAIEVWRRRDP